MSDSRLFKATRRSIRAEVTLILVIVISFSWSAYALYKLALGSSDSLFDFGANQSKLNQKHATQLNQSKPDHEVMQLNSQNLTEQLAIYKSQILKELLARQRQLLFDDSIDRYQAAQPETLDYRRSLFSPTTSNGFRANQIENTPKPVNIEELKQWRGGFKLPTTIDYLFQTTSKQTTQRPTDGSQVDRIPSSSNEHAQGSLNSALIPLTDGPSLMQLSKFKPDNNDKSDAQTARVKEFKLWQNEEELNEPSGDEARLHNEDGSNGDSAVTERQSQGEVTTTTTISPTSYEEESAGTTTVEPNLNVPDDETTPSPMDESTGEGDSKKDEKSADQDQPAPDQHQEEEMKANRSRNDDENNDDDGSMERVKNTVHAIDEEVDRMTQPSLGVASQQDKSFDYKNTVLFDDSLPGSIQRELDNDIQNKVPRSNHAGFHRQDHIPGWRESGRGDETDLQVDDNRSKLPISFTHAASPLRVGPTEGPKMRKHVPKLDAIASSKRNEPPNYEGTRKSVAKTPIRTQQKPTTHVKRREKRSIETNLISKTLDSIGPKAFPRRKHKFLRRSDEQDESDEENQPDSNEDDDQRNSDNQNIHDEQLTPEEKLRSSYQTITSNDPTLQELLAHKRLLDELQQSQVPSPVAWSQNLENQLQSQQQRLNSTFVEPSRQTHRLMVGEAKDRPPDHQSADTRYTVDNGLLLYPAEDEEHHHKSMSKKSKKASHKKAKKKMTVAMKKGGHKKKKHKKEEKKYLKEKKFKGAKKGKKMSKGKGGKGGKKGKKYYKDKGFKKKGFKNIYVKNEFGQKKSYFDEFRDKDFKKKWKNFDDKYNYAQMKKWQAKDVKGAKKMKDEGENYKKYDKGKWKKKYHKHQQSQSAKKKKKQDEF